MLGTLVASSLLTFFTCATSALPTTENAPNHTYAQIEGNFALNTSLGGPPPGFSSRIFTNDKPIDTLQAEDLIVQAMVHIALLPDSFLQRERIIALETIPDVAVALVPRGGQTFLPVHALWGLQYALTWLVDNKPNGFTQVFSTVIINGREIGGVEVLFAEPQNGYRGTIAGTNITDITDLPTNQPQNTSTAIAVSKRDGVSQTDLTAANNSTLLSESHELNAPHVTSTFKWNGIINIGQHNMFLVLANAVTGIFQLQENLNGETYRIRTTWLGAELVVSSFELARQPWNTRTHSLTLVGGLAARVAEEGRFSPITATLEVDEVIVQRTFIIAVPVTP